MTDRGRFFARVGAAGEATVLAVGTLLMGVAMVVMVFEAVSRYAFSQSHWWAEELVRFSVVWSVLLTIGVANRHGHFIRMDVVTIRLGRVGRTACSWVAVVAGLTFCGALFYASWVSIEHLVRIGMRTESNLDLPLWAVRLALPIGSALYGLYFAWAGSLLLRGQDPFDVSAEEEAWRDTDEDEREGKGEREDGDAGRPRRGAA